MNESPHEVAVRVASEYARNNLNEADTRHKLVDVILHEVLCWPRQSVDCEQATNEGFLDYILKSDRKAPLLVLEAKREGVHFELPASPKPKHELRRVKMKTLITDKAIKVAVYQAKAYALDIGSEFAGVTNGHEWVLFVTYRKGVKFEEMVGIVIPSLEFFSKNFTVASNLLHYQSVVKSSSLLTELGQLRDTRDIFYPKNSIGDYDARVNRNEFARYLSPIGEAAFGEIRYTDPDFPEMCYVVENEAIWLQETIEKVIGDSLTPYMANEGIQELQTRDRAGLLGKRIDRNLRNIEGKDVVLLFGGKGSGKSTFLRRALYHSPSLTLSERCVPVFIDMLACTPDEKVLGDEVWVQLVRELDRDEVLRAGIPELLELFSDRYEIAERQNLAGFPTDGEAYAKLRNALLMKWKEDKEYCAIRLARYWRRKSKQVVLVLDNTDQLPGILQDFCFLLAKHVSEKLECLTILSMREERYCRAKTHGILDAYKNTGYHLSAPKLNEVLIRRIEYVLNTLEEDGETHIKLGLPLNAPVTELKAFFRICREEFSKESGHLKKFLERASRGNMRAALEYFRDYITSGYTNIVEMLQHETWTISEHQVLKPILIPDRHNYDETKSRIPNVFQLRTPDGVSSHFTGLRLLDYLKEADPDGTNFRFKDIGNVLDFFDDNGGFRPDVETSLDTMLRHGIIESNNRLERLREERMDEARTSDWIMADAVRLTAFGEYFVTKLACTFTYLDLTSLDCGLRSEKLFHEFCLAAKAERDFAFNKDRLRRLDSRISRVEGFLEYLQAEEDMERQRFTFGDQYSQYAARLKRYFEENEKPRVTNSARRYGRNEPF